MFVNTDDNSDVVSEINSCVHYMTEFLLVTVSQVKAIVRNSPSNSFEQHPIPNSLIKEFIDDCAPFLTEKHSFTFRTSG